MLESKHCLPCSEGESRLKAPSIKELSSQIDPQWSVIKNHHLVREFKFKDFKEALHFTNRVGDVAEQEGHHPDLLLSWGKVRVTIYTHKVDGLTENDFILAAKIDTLH